MDIPQAVKDKAKELIESFGEDFVNLGLYQGKQAYKFVFPKGIRTGFPYLFLYDEQTKDADKITGIEAMRIISSMDKSNFFSKSK